jgi:hypothetical protein
MAIVKTCTDCGGQNIWSIHGAEGCNDCDARRIAKEKKRKTELVYEREVIPQKEDYLGDEVIYWFDHKEDIFDFVGHVSEFENDTKGRCRFGGNFIDVEPEEFEKYIGWVIDDCSKIGIAGYTGSGDDLVIDVIYLVPMTKAKAKELRRRSHIYRADEVSMDERGYVRAWWD